MKQTLDSIYRSTVAGKGQIYNAGVSSASAPISLRQRDPVAIQQEQVTTQKMHEALQKVAPQVVPEKRRGRMNTTLVSPEEAQKELAELLKSSNNKA